MAKRGRPSRERVYERLEFQIDELWHRMGGLPNPLEAADIWKGIWFEEAHHSTAIEGNTLVLKQVEALLEEGRAVGNKQLAEYMEVRGYADASDWVYNQAITPTYQHADIINITEVRRVHQMSMAPVWDVAPHPDAGPDEGPGHFRRHDIHPFPAGMTPPSWVEVESTLGDWIKAVEEIQPGTTEFPEAIAQCHCRFEQIHPFIDGNGRTGRLVLNLVLVRMGYPPAIIYKSERGRYLKALQKADNGEYGVLGEFLARAILDNLYKFVVPAVAGPARIVPLAALADDRISAAALRTAAVRGRLQAMRGPDGQWRSSRNWVDDYIGSRYQRE